MMAKQLDHILERKDAKGDGTEYNVMQCTQSTDSYSQNLPGAVPKFFPFFEAL